METIRKNSNINKFENDSLKILKQLIEDYLKTNIACIGVRKHLEKVKVDDDLLISYLRGRKNKPDIAWDTILRYTENRFKNYPEVFHETLPERYRLLVKNHVLGVLKNRDKLGRRIVFCDLSKWDPAVLSLQDIVITGIFGAEKLWRLPEALENGVIFIENTKGYGIAHARRHSILDVIRMRDILLYSFPVACKGLFFVNMPYLFGFIGRACRPLFSSKMRSRIHFSFANQMPRELFEVASVDTLPTCVGGKLPIEEAAEDLSFYGI